MHRVKRLIALTKLQVEKARARWGGADIAVRTFKRYSEDDAGTYSAALTYFMFFSIFPLLLFAAAALGYIVTDAEQQARFIESGLDTVPILKDALTPEGLRIIQANRNNLAVTGGVLALYSGSGVIVALQHALNKINRVTDEPNFWQKRLRSLVWLAILGAGAVASLALSGVAGFAPGPLAFLLGLAGGLAVNTGLFATAFKVLPGKDFTWRDVLPGSIAAAIGFEILKIGGASYLARGETARDDTFGTFAAAAALLIASYLVAQVILLSAEVNAVLAERRVTRQSSSST